jgi:hypothetical protein
VGDPGASEVLTQAGGFSPSAAALRATRPAATIRPGSEVLVQLVIAAITTAPSGNAAACSRLERRRKGLRGRACGEPVLRPLRPRDAGSIRSSAISSVRVKRGSASGSNQSPAASA